MRERICLLSVRHRTLGSLFCVQTFAYQTVVHAGAQRHVARVNTHAQGEVGVGMQDGQVDMHGTLGVAERGALGFQSRDGSEDWRALLSHTEAVQVASGDALVRLGEEERALYFVVDGALEVSQSTGRTDTLGPLFRELPGSVFGEVSLFDGLPRSASVWAIKPTSLLRLSYDELQAVTSQHVTLANDLLFALGQVLAMRVRLAKARAQGACVQPGRLIALAPQRTRLTTGVSVFE